MSDLTETARRLREALEFTKEDDHPLLIAARIREAAEAHLQALEREQSPPVASAGDEKLARAIINELDSYGRDVCHYNYGLPNDEEHAEDMVRIVMKLLSANRESPLKGFDEDEWEKRSLEAFPDYDATFGSEAGDDDETIRINQSHERHAYVCGAREYAKRAAASVTLTTSDERGEGAE
jgi:hypothetical protein